MLSRSLRSTYYTTTLKSLSKVSTIAAKSSLRFQSTQTETTNIETSTTSKSNDIPNKATSNNSNNNGTSPQKIGNPFVSSLYQIANQNYTEFSPFFEKVQHAFQKASNGEKSRATFSMISVGNVLLTKILTIKEQTNNDVPNSILFKEIITLLIDNKMIHSSHFVRYLKELISEKKYVNALTVWIENVNYFRNNKNSFASKDADNLNERNFNLAGLSLYLLSLLANNEKSVDPEFIKLIFDKKKPSTLLTFERFVQSLQLPAEDSSTIVKLYSAFINASFDINSEESLKSINAISFSGRIVQLENIIDSNLQLYKGKESSIKPETLSVYMKALNTAKLYSRAIDIWKFASTHKIEINIDIWNQLLEAFTNIKIDGSKNKVASVWEIMQNGTKLNSKSYAIYLKYLLKNEEIEKAESILNDLKKNNSKLFDSDLRCSMIEFLTASNKTNEAFQLFKIYQKDEKFVPTIFVYNRLLSKLIVEKKYIDAETLLNELISAKYKSITPDTATWTTIIDFLLKSSAESGLSQDEILIKIFAIIDSMKSEKVQFNNVAFITVANNLLRNPQTQDVGFSILQHLESSNIKLNSVGYTGIITTFAKAGDMDNALYYYNKALSKGIPLTTIFYNSILKGYSNNPNIKATKEFMSKIKSSIKGNPNNNKILPNKYTYYFLLLQGVYAKDSQFVNETLKDLGESNTDLGNELPKILTSLKSNGYQVPESLFFKMK